MPFYLRQENGDKILLEDLTGAVILETVAIAPATVYYQGGAGHPAPHRKKRRHETAALFANIERTLQEALGLVPPVVAGAPVPAEAAPPAYSSAGLEAALADLATLAEGRRSYLARIERLRKALAQADDDRRREDDDEFWLLMS